MAESYPGSYHCPESSAGSSQESKTDLVNQWTDTAVAVTSAYKNLVPCLLTAECAGKPDSDRFVRAKQKASLRRDQLRVLLHAAATHLESERARDAAGDALRALDQLESICETAIEALANCANWRDERARKHVHAEPVEHAALITMAAVRTLKRAFLEDSVSLNSLIDSMMGEIDRFMNKCEGVPVQSRAKLRHLKASIGAVEAWIDERLESGDGEPTG